MKRIKTPLLDKIKNVGDLRKLSEDNLSNLSNELRNEVISAVSQTGGHLGAGLGVVELTIALHYIFDTPTDKVIWDVGHQAYPHKILTSRRKYIRTLRKEGGLSGFTNRSESIYDPFGAGHSSTSISAGIGMAISRDLLDKNHHVLSVIGDGAMSAGMAFEALNNAGAMKTDFTVILNDNDMSIAPAVGAMSSYLSELISSNSFNSMRSLFKNVTDRLPREFKTTAKKAEELAKELVGKNSIFNKLGFFYIGPINGHNFDHLLPIFKNIKERKIRGPILLHIVTEKGKGHPFSTTSNEKFHAVPEFNVITGEHIKTSNKKPTFTSVFSNTLIKLAKDDKKVIAITAAMLSGTGLDKMKALYPDRVFDVGIAEQHAVTFAAGLAAEGLIPFVAIYSTFLQRGYDQIIHDVSIQSLPVRFAIDRSGLVGADGATHAGIYDLVYLSCLPNFVIFCPSDEEELVHMLTTAKHHDDGPSAIRYPRGTGPGALIPKKGKKIEIGKSRTICRGDDLVIISLGCMLEICKEVVGILSKKNIKITLIDMRFAKPFDKEILLKISKKFNKLFIIEESAPGGFSAHVLQFLSDKGLLFDKLDVRVLSLPDKIIEHAERKRQLEIGGLDKISICKQIEKFLVDKKDRDKIA